MSRAAMKHATEAPPRSATPEARAISNTMARMRTAVRNLNRIASRIDRKLGKRLRKLEALRQ